MRNCFAVLWNGSSGAQASSLSPRERLGGQLQALRFCLLEGTSSTLSKVPLFVEEALSEYERARGGLSQDDAVFLLSEFRTLFLSVHMEQDHVLTPPLLAVRCEAVVRVCKLLCKNRLWDEAARLVGGALECVRKLGEGLCLALGLASRAVRLHRDLGTGRECNNAFTDCARILRGLPAVLSDTESHTLLEACQLVVWATEAGQSKGMGGATLLASFSFWEEYQEFLLKQQKVTFLFFSLSLFLSEDCVQTFCLHVLELVLTAAAVFSVLQSVPGLPQHLRQFTHLTGNTHSHTSCTCNDTNQIRTKGGFSDLSAT